jgi:CDP-glycerol glycerophosphotransferase
MPRLSVILVGHDDARLLEASQASAATQNAAGVELLTTADPGAAARNRALDEASGDYAWFVEPHDVLLPGSLAHVTERLDATSPDVLVVHHSTIDLAGRTHEGPHRRLLQKVAGEGPRTVRERAGLADTAPRAWNKVLRREHVRASGGRFSPGGHGELTLTWPALLAAESIAAAPLACYVRTRPAGAGPAPFDVFDRYDAVLAAAPDAALVVPAMLRHQLELLRRLPEEQRREFFHRMAEGLRRHATGREPRPRGRVGRLRWRLVAHDAYAAFRLLEQARVRRPSPRRMRRRSKARARRRELERYYGERLREPVDARLAVYAAYWFRGYACNPKAIYEKARELVPEVRGVWVVKREEAAAMPPGVDHVVAGTREYFDVIARAKYLVNNVNFPDHLVKREGTVHVQTHHGTPLKHMGLDLRDTPVAGRRMNFEALRRRVGRWDYSVSANPHTTPIWQRVYPGSYETLEVGYPRNDVLATASDEDVRRVRGELGIGPQQTAVLYAPTHREYQPGYVAMADLARLADALGPDHVVLARVHYFYDSAPLVRELHDAGRIRDVASHPSIEDLCLAADALVTDYSSLMFDYAVLDRPIVIHAPDWEVYRALRGVYFDLPAEPPGPFARTEEELIDALASRAAWGAESARARAAFRARFCSLEDGRAAERVVRRVWLSEREAPARAVASRVR